MDLIFENMYLIKDRSPKEKKNLGYEMVELYSKNAAYPYELDCGAPHFRAADNVVEFVNTLKRLRLHL